MSWIPEVEPEQATGDAARALARLGERGDRPAVNNVWRVLANDPAGMETLLGWRTAVMQNPAPLSAIQAQAVALVISATNGSAYAVTHHGRGLGRALGDEGLARAGARDYREADLPARDPVLLDYAVALTCEPGERTAADLERLREYGFDDAAILKATEITAFVNAMNRIVCGLGVRLEAGVEAWEFGAQR